MSSIRFEKFYKAPTQWVASNGEELDTIEFEGVGLNGLLAGYAFLCVLEDDHQSITVSVDKLTDFIIRDANLSFSGLATKLVRDLETYTQGYLKVMPA